MKRLFTGADIANICNESALHAARYKKAKISGDDLSYAVDRIIGGPEKRHRTTTLWEKRVLAHHEAGHALVSWLLEHTDALIKVSIVPRTNLKLGSTQVIPTDQKLFSKEQLLDRMCMTLGGRVAEAVVFNSVTSGAENDLTKVTKMAYTQIQQFGMNEAVGLVSFSQESTSTVRILELKLGLKFFLLIVDFDSSRRRNRTAKSWLK